MFDGNLLKQLRNNKNLNQIELAEKLGCSQANISSYENNRTRPDYEVLLSMSKFFKVSIDYLLGQSNTDLNSLSENEDYIVKTYRSLNESQRIDFLSMIKLLNDIKKSKKGET
jgi:transcriptional regulator with XRE-family HTH domain